MRALSFSSGDGGVDFVSNAQTRKVSWYCNSNIGWITFLTDTISTHGNAPLSVLDVDFDPICDALGFLLINP